MTAWGKSPTTNYLAVDNHAISPTTVFKVVQLFQGYSETYRSLPAHKAVWPSDPSSDSSSSEEDSESITAPKYSPIMSKESPSDLSSSECENELNDHATDEPVTQGEYFL